MAARTPADFYIPRNRLPPAAMAALRDTVLDAVRMGFDAPGSTPADRLTILAAAVLPMAQVLLGAGTHPAIVVGHAAELLESMFLAEALADSPALLHWFSA
jgi:hypothetical protein